MEPGEKELIRSNITELISCTDCNETLLAELEKFKVLARIDVQEIRYSRVIPEEKARKLYEILESRVDSFSSLLAALHATRQTGAVDILLQRASRIKNHGLIDIDQNHILGTGRNGNKVYLGTFDYQRVAVKVVREEDALTEVEHLRSLRVHDNIIRYYFAENRNGFVYIALELCEITLEEEILYKKFKIECTLILKKCTNGIAYLHSENLIHRDLKPTNILINRAKQIKISDFGFSVKVNPDASAIEISGKFGTLHWMAPEVLRHFMTSKKSSTTPKMSRRSDIFSLGCIFFFVLSKGDHPFQADLISDIYNRILKSKSDSLPDPLNEQWGALITSMLELSPSLRPTAEEILLGNWFTQKDLVIDGTRIQPLKSPVSEINDFCRESATRVPQLDGFHTKIHMDNGGEPNIRHTGNTLVVTRTEKLNITGSLTITETKIGMGSLGTCVYEGLLSNKVAVKCVYERKQRERAIKEINVMIYLSEIFQHQNIVAYYGHRDYPTNDRIDIILEYCNADLRKWMENPTVILPGSIKKIDVLEQAAAGLEFLHSKHILHRDIEPGNILLKVTGSNVTAKIADFGITKFLPDGASSATLTRVVGKESWRAPEVLEYIDELSADDERPENPIQMSPESDVFSLGLVFYFVLGSMEHPFGRNMHLRRINCMNPAFQPDLKNLGAGFKTMEALIKKMIRFAPQERPAAEEVVKQLNFLKSSTSE